MRKLKLFFAAAALAMGVVTVSAADEDYTDRITNANLASKDGWTFQATGGDWSTVQGSSPSYVIEAYAGWDPLSLTAYSMKQDVTLPSGKYRAEGFAFYRYGLNAGTDPTKSYAKFVAGDFSAPVVTLGGETLDATLTAYPNTTAEASAAFTNGYYKSQVEFAIESESTIEFGYEGTHVLRQSWFIAGPIKLYRTGDFDYSLYQSQLEGLVNDAKALQSSTMAASIKTVLDAVVTKYDGQTCASVAKYNEAYAELNAAISNANKSIASYAIIASGIVRTDDLNGWTCTNTQTFHINTWSTEGNSDGSGMTTPFIENWVGKGSFLGEGTFSYTIEYLEPGEVYYAQALIRSYNEANATVPNGPDFFVNETTAKLSEVGTNFTFNGMSGIYATLGAAATVGSDGKITIGARIANNANYNWVAFKNVSIMSMDDALATAVAKVTVLDGTIPAAAYDAAYAVVTANTGANKPTDAAGYEAAIAAIEAAATTASALVAPYAAWNVAKDETIALFGSTLGVADPTTATTVEELVTARQNLNIAQYNKVATDYTYSLSGLIGDFGSWTGTATVNGNSAEPNYLSNEHWSGQTHAYYEQASNGWGSNAWTIKYEKKCTLPAGQYVIKVAARASVDVTGTISCSATTNTVALPNFSSPGRGINTSGVASWSDSDTFANGNISQAGHEPSVGGNGTGWQWRFLPFTLTEKTEVTMIFYAETNKQYNWMSIADGELLSANDVATAVAYDETATNTITATDIANVTMTRTIKNGFNTVVLPFTLTANQVKDAFGDGTEVYNYSEASADANNAEISFNKGDGSITANVPVLVKATNASSEQTFNGVQIVAADAKVAGKNFDFVGTYAPVSAIAAGDYFIGNGAIYKSTGATSMNAFRAYIHAKSAGARVARFFIDGIETTGIEALEVGGTNNGKIYNMNGQEVKSAKKGLYIQNGKKVIIK